MNLRVIQPDETQDDPHAEAIARTAKARRILTDLFACDHGTPVLGCRGCVAQADLKNWQFGCHH